MVNGKSIRLTIPAGVKNGQVIKIKGYGGEGMNNGPKGDRKLVAVNHWNKLLKGALVRHLLLS